MKNSTASRSRLLLLLAVAVSLCLPACSTVSSWAAKPPTLPALTPEEQTGPPPLQSLRMPAVKALPKK